MKVKKVMIELTEKDPRAIMATDEEIESLEDLTRFMDYHERKIKEGLEYRAKYWKAVAERMRRCFPDFRDEGIEYSRPSRTFRVKKRELY